ncbi:MAG: hypothetical protein ACO1OF_06615 [Adhaeribacter sp.]
MENARSKDRTTFWYLVVAYLISMAYQYYRYTLHQHPADTFGTTEIAGYAFFLGWSGLALVDKRWAVLATLALCVIQLSIGLFYYFPVIFRYRHDNFWDWAEAFVFIMLIALAGYRSVLHLNRPKQQYQFR